MMPPVRYRCPWCALRATGSGRWVRTTTHFLALEAADPAFANLSAYFEGCRVKRNSCEYDFAGGMSDTDADGLLATVQQFAADAEA